MEDSVQVLFSSVTFTVSEYAAVKAFLKVWMDTIDETPPPLPADMLESLKGAMVKLSGVFPDL